MIKASSGVVSASLPCDQRIGRDVDHIKRHQRPAYTCNYPRSLLLMSSESLPILALTCPDHSQGQAAGLPVTLHRWLPPKTVYDDFKTSRLQVTAAASWPI